MESNAENAKIPVSETMYTAAKAIYGAGVALLAFIALIVKSFADGGVSGDEVGEMVGALVALASVIGTVYGVRNKPKL